MDEYRIQTETETSPLYLAQFDIAVIGLYDEK